MKNLRLYRLQINWLFCENSCGEVLVALVEKAMAPHSSVLAWKIPWMEEPGRLQSMGSRRVGHDWATSLSLFTFMHWRRKWQPTPVFLPGESQKRGSLVGCHLWGHTESDTTEVTQQQQQQHYLWRMFLYNRINDLLRVVVNDKAWIAADFLGSYVQPIK